MSQFNNFLVDHKFGQDQLMMLNAFLRSHRILHVDKQFTPEGWAFCVEWVEGVPSSSAGDAASYRRAEKVDYMKVLEPEVFARFSALRTRRKELAAEKGIRPYEVMTDAQLAEVAKLEEPTLAAIGRIPGVGESRVKRFGHEFIAVMQSMASEPTEDDDISNAEVQQS